MTNGSTTPHDRVASDNPTRASAPSLADLFPSRADREPPPLPTALLRDQSVLVTGAGGSLGGALARQLAALPLRRLILVDTSEHGLVQLQRRIDARDPTPQVTYRLADLRLLADRERVLRTGPTTVLHAAAYKHVPFLEERPIVAAQNNVLATADWRSACRAHGTPDRFVLVSTDKAVRPVSVMGATKAAAERIVRAAGADDGTSALPTTVVRLCNVFGSRGSVVPRFRRRLQNGKPLPVTHPDMERWFISPDAAARCVVQALRHGSGPYVPTACRSVNILRLAHRLVRWHRPVTGDLLGARPSASPDRETVRAFVRRLRRHCVDGAPRKLRDALFELEGASPPPLP